MLDGGLLNVVCCLWGDWPEPGWGEEYVRRLERGVRRNISVPIRFICFSDRKFEAGKQIDVRELNAPSWKGCLPKLFVYSPEACLNGRTLLLDLDNVITGDLREMASYGGDIAVRAWFKGYDRGERVPDGDMIGFEAGSNSAQYIWDKFSSDVDGAERATGGRERFFLREHSHPDLWQDVLSPGYILSYKNHLRGKDAVPSTCKIVSMHDGGKSGGTCRPHQVDAPWLKEHWK
jgi:hypothetical protein